jgi:uncharacterized protein YggL (DUF469 family)
MTFLHNAHLTRGCSGFVSWQFCEKLTCAKCNTQLPNSCINSQCTVHSGQNMPRRGDDAVENLVCESVASVPSRGVNLGYCLAGLHPAKGEHLHVFAFVCKSRMYMADDDEHRYSIQKCCEEEKLQTCRFALFTSQSQMPLPWKPQTGHEDSYSISLLPFAL